MDEFLDFLFRHWVLTGTFAILLAWFFQSGANTVVKGINLLSTAECINKINHEHGVLIDIREQEKFKTGYIVNSINVPLSDLENSLKKLQKYKTKPTIVTCQAGQTSVRGATILKENEFKDVYVLKGGIQEWLAEELPLVKK